MTLFDYITILGVLIFAVIACISVFLLYKKEYVRLSATVLILMLIGIGVLVYGSLIEPQWIEYRRNAIDISGEEEQGTLKVVLVADYHVGPYKGERFVRRSVEMINAENPDVILIPGDFIYYAVEDASYLEPLSDLEATYGVYATLGNHDFGISRYDVTTDQGNFVETASSSVAETLESFSVEVLRNEHVILETDQGTVEIVGLDDLWGRTNVGFDTAFSDNTAELPTIMIEHNPDIILYNVAARADLIVTGHTHGGQIRLPFIGPVWQLPTRIGRDYVEGLYDGGWNNQLYITKGIGEMGPRARLFTRPEIVVLDVKI